MHKKKHTVSIVCFGMLLAYSALQLQIQHILYHQGQQQGWGGRPGCKNKKKIISRVQGFHSQRIVTTCNKCKNEINSAISKFNTTTHKKHTVQLPSGKFCNVQCWANNTSLHTLVGRVGIRCWCVSLPSTSIAAHCATSVWAACARASLFVCCMCGNKYYLHFILPLCACVLSNILCVFILPLCATILLIFILLTVLTKSNTLGSHQHQSNYGLVGC